MTVYNGRYELSNQVARGGTAQVFLARDLLLDRPVALKVLFPELSTDATFVERFRREAQAAANLSHPNIVPVFDWGQAENTYFIVMEFVDGEALSSIIRTQAPLEQLQAASIAADIAKALGYAHRHGVVHRDVKPGNVLITADGQVKVTDFGIARAIGSDEQVTQTGLVMGTATYFSPEQAQGLEVDGRSDIYSLGVVLYEMATGHAPFSGETPVAIAYQHVRETAPTPRSLNPNIAPSLEAIIEQAMAKLPAERYQTADELRSDLDRYVRGQTVLARPPSEFRSAQTTTAVALAGDEDGGGGGETTAFERSGNVPGERRTTPYWIAAAVLLLLGIAAAIGITGRDLGYFGGAKYFTVPDVESMQGPAAIAKLKSEGLQVRTQPARATGPGDAYTVITQNPEYPTSVRRNDTVRLVIAGAAPTKSLPSVLGMSEHAASLELTNDGFVVKTKSVQGPANAVGNVTAQSPKAGKSLGLGTTITLSVVVGVQQEVVPSAIASTTAQPVSQAEAGADLNAVHLQASATVVQQISSTVPAGDVITTQAPYVPGSKVPIGTTITLIVSEGPGVALPTITYKEPAANVEQALQQAGLTWIVSSVSTLDTTLVGDVSSWSTESDKIHHTKTVPAGSTIYLTVWQQSPTLGNTGTTTPTVGNSGTATSSTTVPSSSTTLAPPGTTPTT